jgi:hypothetical protein
VSDRFAVVAEVIGLGGILPLVRFLAHCWNILEFRRHEAGVGLSFEVLLVCGGVAVIFLRCVLLDAPITYCASDGGLANFICIADLNSIFPVETTQGVKRLALLRFVSIDLRRFLEHRVVGHHRWLGFPRCLGSTGCHIVLLESLSIGVFCIVCLVHLQVLNNYSALRQERTNGCYVPSSMEGVTETFPFFRKKPGQRFHRS